MPANHSDPSAPPRLLPSLADPGPRGQSRFGSRAVTRSDDSPAADRSTAPTAAAILWRMLATLGPVPTHGLFVGLGVLAALLVFVSEARRRGHTDDRLLIVVTGALVGGAL